MNTSDLLEQLLRAGQGGSASSSGGLGGLLGGLLKGTSTGNASAAGGLGGLLGGLGGMLGGATGARPAQGRSGGMNYAALASLGMAAFQAYQAWQRQQASAPQQAIQTVDQLDGPAAEAHSHAVLRALIAAAKADGHIDEKEQQLISSELGRHTDDPQLQAWLDAEVAKPLDAADFAEFASDPAVAAEVYLASVMLVDDQQDAERNYLDDLAGQLQIDPQLQLHLEQQAKA
ncbi:MULTISPECIES: tellurite resistance TerB family protein [Pseudomonas]|uniref:tellurite resistance TerB family protein n=1 Tax=Pseudomonas TaxID=286 RepID=UPI001C6618F5|nr:MULTISPECIES: tellurite resistance TerB family protein [unclassified Pseudomonas]MBW8126818.1 tellurite resistance TerB family protein [Pseudomonas sp. LAP_36]MBW8135161.1 tellurite resistance TerB family protein [Pseudomonas sp. PAMC 26818]